MKRSLTRRGAAPLLILLLLGVREAGAQATAPESERNSNASVVESATFLLVPVGARSVGLGGAISATRGDIEGTLWNPASIAGLERNAVFLMGGEDFAADSRVIGGILAWRDLRIGLTILHFDLGQLEARDAANQSLGTIDPSQTAFVLSAAYPVAAWLDLGAAGKLLRLSSSCSQACASLDDASTGFAFDLGAVATPPGTRGMRVGLLFRNLGAGIAYAGGPSDPLPARIRLGMEFDMPAAVGRPDAWAGGDLGLLLRLDLQEPLSEFDDLDAFFGAELGWRRVLLVRGGYAWSSEGRSGPTLGVGLRYKRLILDLGYGFNDFAEYAEGTPLQLSAGYEF